MARSPLKRKTPLKRTRMRRKPRSTSYARRERDMDRMGWIKRQVCCLQGAQPEGAQRWGVAVFATHRCGGPVEAHHAGRHGVGQKAADDTCIPICQDGHRQLTDLSGVFRDWPRGWLRQWQDLQIARYRGRYESHLLLMRDAGQF